MKQWLVLFLLLPFSGSSTGVFKASVQQLEDQIVWIEQWESPQDAKETISFAEPTKQYINWKHKSSTSDSQLLTISSYEGL